MGKRLMLLLFFLMIFLCGCAGEAPQPDENKVLYDKLFDIHSHISLNISMSDEELAKMQDDYTRYTEQGSKSPIYRMADLTVTITQGGETETYTIPQVGVRMKGNTSRNDFYTPETGIHSLIHLKLSFQETFDKEAYYGSDALQWEDEARKERKSRTFAGLEKLDLRWNRCDDATYIKELYAMDAYRSAGVIAPRITLASVDFGGLHQGVFTLNETIDDIFLARNLPESDLGGDLYKCAWADHGASLLSTDSIGIENEDKGCFYSYDLKTNKKTSQHQAITNFIEKLNGPVLSREELASILDVEQFLNFAAVSYLLGGPDDLRNNYNNYYLYFPPSGKAIFIPYDCDRVLGVLKDWDPTGNGQTKDSPFSKYQSSNGQAQQCPLYPYTVQQGGYFVREYGEALERILQQQWLNPEHFEEVYNIFRESYQDETAPEKPFRNAGGYQLSFAIDSTRHGNMPFSDYITTKKATALAALQKIDGYAKGSPSILPNYYIRSGFINWEMQPSYGMELQSDGTYRQTVSDGSTIYMKVYYRNEDTWLGAEHIANTTVPYESDEYGNIVLAPGKYTVTYDPKNREITLING